MSLMLISILQIGLKLFSPDLGVTAMRIPVWVKPGVWGSVVGAIAISILGFSQMGWTTGGSADRMATERASAAVVAAFVPFCVAKAQQDADGAKLVKLGGETSSYGLLRCPRL